MRSVSKKNKSVFLSLSEEMLFLSLGAEMLKA
jgi:hypothetical protein